MFNEHYSEEYQTSIWKAGELAPSGIYVRIDDHSSHIVTLDSEGLLPATFDGHVAYYCLLPKMDIKRVEQRLVLVC